MISRLREQLASLRKSTSSENLNEGVGRWLAKKTFTTTDRLTLYEDLAFLLDNNQKVEKALLAMIGSYNGKRPPMVYCLEDMLTALRQGKSVDQGLISWIPKQEASILSSGVQDGNLAAALYRAITVVKGMAEMKKAVVSTLAYPGLLLGTSFAMMNMVKVYFLPRLESMTPRENWHGALWWLSAISEFFVDNAILLGIALLIFLAFIVWSLPNMTGNIRQHILDRLLPWSVYRDVQGVAFLLNFSALMRADVKTENAIEILCRHAPPWLYERLAATLRQVRQGNHMGLALRDAGYNFPSARAINKLVLLTGGDNSEVIIENFARVWLEQSVARIKRTAILLSNLALATNAGYMLLIILSTQNLNDLVGTH
ncbi:type II secretion system F family protein (plasmid) [Edwardsiella piscicida]|uniref:type II secretion system F family protein n=1 Tax=Edwardsiella TaxID=635 RepID=UPI001F42B7E1|nr:type II secretion system F family protein [Edwardsiella piscicida]UJT80922.1 type II secretion system F family protein [Edwardsiella piscicida]